jgi:hypothetical protein
MAIISLPEFGAALAALSALSTAAFGLLDSTKAFWGGVSLVGLGHLRRSLTPFSQALDAAAGPGAWWVMVQANWINGVPKADQKVVVSSLLKLGLSKDTAAGLALGSRVSPEALAKVADKLDKGLELTEQDLNVLGRMNAALEATPDAAFERAEQQYRNVSRLLAGLIALGLAWTAAFFVDGVDFVTATAVGLLAVPVAPVAKDLTSALSTAMRALKAARAV